MVSIDNCKIVLSTNGAPKLPIEAIRKLRAVCENLSDQTYETISKTVQLTEEEEQGPEADSSADGGRLHPGIGRQTIDESQSGDAGEHAD